MDNPSDICDASSVCGDGSPVGLACDEVQNSRMLGLGKSTAVTSCDSTCDDIASPVLREACDKDLKLH